jgi:LPS-assembly protein
LKDETDFLMRWGWAQQTACSFFILLMGIAGFSASSPAQNKPGTLNDALASRARNSGEKSKLVMDARELVYDNNKNTVTALGDVQLNYDGRTLQADKVVYDRGTGRVLASGNARLTETDGTVATADRFDLTDDFKSGFVDALRMTTKDKTRFSSPRVERSDGQSTVFDRGTYTACEPCKDNPEKPPLWQVKAARIIHNNDEHTIYYEDATLEFAGIPVAYMPYFWSPDPTIKRKTGFLAPTYVASSTLGSGFSLPFFWALAPNYDLTIRPSFLSRQGILGQAEWRHRLETGSYNIRAAGIFQQDKGAFLSSPLGAREKDFRGSLETTGRFFINERWNYGWDIAFLSDKWFLQNYRVRSDSLATNYFRESISTAYLQGQGDRSWFDMRGYYFKGLSTSDWQKQQPIVLPVVDYNRRFDGPDAIGGEFTLDANITHLSRDAAQFQQVPKQLTQYYTYKTATGSTGSIYDTCSIFERGQCLVRGIGGTYSRLSAQASWRRQMIDTLGQSWTPFAYLRADAFSVRPDTDQYQNARINNFIGADNDNLSRLLPAIGVEYRFPLLVDMGASATQIVEPIVQVVARPNEAGVRRLVNEDAQSLVFDDTSLFDVDKFSGYDRAEGGVRANVGAQYSLSTQQGLYANALFGQSIHLAGRNSYRTGDVANVGLDSGLESKRSDYVGRFLFSPNKNLNFTARSRFDERNFERKRIEIGASGALPSIPVTLSMMYAQYAAQPALGLDRRREGLLTALTYNLTPNWYISGATVFDMGRYLVDKERYIAALAVDPNAVYNKSAYWTLGSLNLGAGYRDECTTFSLNYVSSLKDNADGTKERVQSVLLRLELRTLGQANLTQNLSTSTSQDGISQ